MADLTPEQKELRERVRKWFMAYVKAPGIKNDSHFVRLVGQRVKSPTITGYKVEGAAIGIDAIICLRKVFGANINKMIDHDVGTRDDDYETIRDEVSAVIGNTRAARSTAPGRERQRVRQG